MDNNSTGEETQVASENGPETTEPSGKKKAVHKAPQGFKTTWVWLDLSEADNLKLRSAARQNDMKVEDFAAKFLEFAVQNEWGTIEEAAAKWDEKHPPAPPKSAEELQKELEKMLAKQAAINAQLEKLKAAQDK